MQGRCHLPAPMVHKRIGVGWGLAASAAVQCRLCACISWGSRASPGLLLLPPCAGLTWCRRCSCWTSRCAACTRSARPRGSGEQRGVSQQGAQHHRPAMMHDATHSNSCTHTPSLHHSSPTVPLLYTHVTPASLTPSPNLTHVPQAAGGVLPAPAARDVCGRGVLWLRGAGAHREEHPGAGVRAQGRGHRRAGGWLGGWAVGVAVGARRAVHEGLCSAVSSCWRCSLAPLRATLYMGSWCMHALAPGSPVPCPLGVLGGVHPAARAAARRSARVPRLHFLLLWTRE